MSTFRSLSSEEMRVFLLATGRQRTGTHKMSERILHWRYCAQCGLLGLKNEVSRKALRAACTWTED